MSDDNFYVIQRTDKKKKPVNLSTGNMKGIIKDWMQYLVENDLNELSQHMDEIMVTRNKNKEKWTNS